MPTCRPPRTSPRQPSFCHASRRQRRRGLSLTELLVASTVLTLIAGSMGTLALTVQTASDHCQSQNTAAQHARVAGSRIQAAVAGATASEAFPGCAVFSESVGSYTFPDTLVVWRPATVAVDPQGLPRVSELVVYCPDPVAPNRLLEIRKANDASMVPALSNAAAWQTLLASLKTGSGATRTALSQLLRTASTSSTNVSSGTSSGGTSSSGTSSGSGTNLRGCVRFNLLMAPNSSEWANYRAGTVAWGDLAWPLNLYGSQTGMRRVACQWEIQFDGSSAAVNPTALPSVPSFGSATVSYLLNR